MFSFCCLMFVEWLALVSAIIPTTRDRQSGLQPGLGIHSSALSFFRSRHILKKSSGSDSLPSLFTKERFVLFTMLFPFFMSRTKERIAVKDNIRSLRSLKEIDESHSLTLLVAKIVMSAIRTLKRENHTFILSLSKNDSHEKSKSKLPTLPTALLYNSGHQC